MVLRGVYLPYHVNKKKIKEPGLNKKIKSELPIPDSHKLKNAD